jgi:hypothetical protein
MQRLFPKRVSSGALLTGCLLAFGCASPGEQGKSPKDQEIADLKAQSDRRQEAISKAQETIVGLREQIEQLVRERSKLSSEVARLEGSCRSQSELAARLEAQSTVAADRLARSEEVRLRLERTQLQVVQILETVQHNIGSLASTPSNGSETPPAPGPGQGSSQSGPRSFSEKMAWLGSQVQIARNLLQYPAERQPDLAGSLGTLQPEPESGGTSPSQGPKREAAQEHPQPEIATGPKPSETPKPVTVGFWSSFGSLVGGHVSSLLQRGKALTAADVTFLGAILVFVVACMWILGTPLRMFLRAHKDKELGLLRRVVRALEKKEKESSPAVAPPPVASEAPEKAMIAAALEQLTPPGVDPSSPSQENLPEVKRPCPAEPDVSPSTPQDDDKETRHHDTQHICNTAQEDFTQTQAVPGAIKEDFTQTQEMPKVSEDEFRNTQVIAGEEMQGPSPAAPAKVLKETKQTQVLPGSVPDEYSRTQQMPSADQDFRATQALPEVPLDEFASTQTIQKPASGQVEEVAGPAPGAGRPASLQPGKSHNQAGSRQDEKPLKPASARGRQQKSVPAQKSASPIGELSSNKELLDELEQLMGKRPGRQK